VVLIFVLRKEKPVEFTGWTTTRDGRVFRTTANAARVSPSAKVGNATLFPGAVIEDGAVVEDGAVIGRNVTVGRDAHIGANIHVYDRNVLPLERIPLEETILGVGEAAIEAGAQLIWKRGHWVQPGP